MKRFMSILLLAVLVHVPTIIYAQTSVNKAEVPFRFIYIAHDDEVVDEPGVLIEMLNQIKENIGYSNGFPCIYYLSNGVRIDNPDSLAGKPIIIKENLPGDNSDDFVNILLRELQEKVSHEVDADADIENILKLLDDNDVFDSYGNLLYESVVFDFYVNQTFWNMNCNDYVIAKLYFILDANRHDKQKLRFNIHYIQSNKPEFAQNTEHLFGIWNVNGINSAFPQVQILK